MTALLDATDSQMAMLADLVASLEAAEATLSSMQAARDGMLAMAGRLAVDIARESAHPDHGDMAIRTVAAEIGAAQRVSDRTIERRMAEASWLVERFPAVWAAQGEGRISGAHSRVIVEASTHLDDAVDRRAYAAEAVTLAESESPNQLRRLARRLAERFQERTITERHRDAREKRRVWVKDLDDGMAELGTHGPAALVHGMFDRLSQMAHAVKEENARPAKVAASGTDIAGEDSVGEEYVADERSVDQLRADLLSDLVLTGVPTGHDAPEGLLGAIHAHVEVSVPAMTLMEDDQASPEANDLDLIELGIGDDLDRRPDGIDPRLTDRDVPPAELDGATPIDARTARVLAGSATGWDGVFTHPISGAMLAVDRYRPSANTCDGIFERETNAAGSRDAESGRENATSTTITLLRAEARPLTRTSPRSAGVITCSSTTPHGMSSSGRVASWNGRAQPDAVTSTGHQPRTPSCSPRRLFLHRSDVLTF